METFIAPWAHTQGTWLQNHNQIVVDNEHKTLIAEVNVQNANFGGNARLLVAAPVLLDALKLAREHCERLPDDAKTDHLVRMIAQAISHAT